ncbi:hypothetical protein [Solimonas terrae]|uniref:Uncharacterized protein n=1 Tax=Solimonas terrae TaxID=1396819 RepID=A0A6M2BW50_9GAMM|nr:hypothetical protein [Solimonas terrae]NGY06624.1 hypothetical protein [Solimonas terrae]
MSKKGDWSDHDNKRYRGKIDRMYVSDTEYYEVEYYIDHYLESKGFAINNANRDVVAREMESFPGRAPHKRADMDKFLDGRIKKKA